MKINNIVIISLILMLSLFLIACSNQDQTLAEMPVADNVKEVTPSSEANGIAEAATSEEPIINLDEETINLIEKGKEYTNFDYLYEVSNRNQYGSYIQDRSYHLYYLKGQIKKTYSEAIKVGQNFQYTEVYFSENDADALVTCALNILSCEDYRNQGYKINAAVEKLKVTPITVLDNIPLSAEKGGANENIDNRKTIILTYPVGNNFERVFLDSYYGLPLKMETYTYDVDEIVVLKTEKFSKLSVNGVKIAMLTLPEGYTILN